MLRVKDAQDVDVVGSLVIEYQPGEAPRLPSSQAFNSQFVGVPLRANTGIAADPLEALLDRIDEPLGEFRPTFCLIEDDGLVDILPRPLARDDGS